VHFFRRVPLDVVEVVVGDGGHEAGRVAEHGLEVALRGGHEVGVVHEQSRVRPTHADPAIQFSLVADLFTYSYLYIPVKSLNAVGSSRFGGTHHISCFVDLYSPGSTIKGLALCPLQPPNHQQKKNRESFLLPIRASID
jgi:hypothetical protein